MKTNRKLSSRTILPGPEERATHSPAETAAELLGRLKGRRQQMVDTVRQLVELESPSNNKAAADRLCKLLAELFDELDGRIKIHPQQEFGNQLQVDFPGGETGSKPVMLLGHYDTVWEVGTLATMPFRIAAGRLWGPGVFDMKSGIVLMLHAIESLREQHGELPRPVTVLLNADEEMGSPHSRPLTEALARDSAAVLVVEPAQGLEGALKTARKGVGDYTLKVTGKASHAGLDFEKGENAIVELARQIERLSGFTDLKRGITVNVGMVHGGTRSNVVAPEATAEVDVRIRKLSDAAYIERKFRTLRPFNRKCHLEVTGGVNRMPMERTGQVARLFELARELGRGFGMDLQEAAVGGGSDGNFTAVLAPTLDGLGAVGEGAHAATESVLIQELPRRAALLAGLIEVI